MKTITFIIILFVAPSILLTLGLCKAASKTRRCEEAAEEMYSAQPETDTYYKYRPSPKDSKLTI